jgi:hypothetical protein
MMRTVVRFLVMLLLLMLCRFLHPPRWTRIEASRDRAASINHRCDQPCDYLTYWKGCLCGAA